MERAYDIIVCGGGVAGGLFSISHKKRNPNARILLIEQAASFHKKVGESSSDVTGIFLRRLGIEDVLERQIKKTGLRFLFNDDKNHEIDNSSDFSSPSIRSVANGWQLNRATFDDDLIKKAAELGVTVLRPISVLDVEYAPFNCSVKIENQGKVETLQARWIVDCSGRRALFAKKLGWRHEWAPHPTASSWAHFDDPPTITELNKKFDHWWDRKCIGDRQFATTHFLGKGYWVWHIPLHDNSVSIGIVYDQRIIKLGDQSPKDHFFEFCRTHPTLSRIALPEKAKGFRHLPYLPHYSDRYYDKGLVTIGDAASFIDPLFSPGIELTATQVMWTSKLIAKDLNENVYCEKSWRKYEKYFRDSLRTRFALFEDRYYLMGDMRCFSLLTQLDFAGYYSFIILPAASFPNWLKMSGRFNPLVRLIYIGIKRRLIALAEERERSGLQALENIGYTRHSHAAVPNQPFRYLKGPWLFALFIFRYTQFELEMLVHRLRRTNYAATETPAPSATVR